MPEFFSFDPEPRVPSRKPPPLACDSQFHVFGPASRYPVVPGSAYEMPTATIERALGLILVSRNLERIADHATNIAEDVIFLVEAKDVRHHHEEPSR